MRLTLEDINGYPAEITKLDYSHKDIGSIDGRIFEVLENLQWLYLSNNQLTSLSDSFGNLTNLTHLYLWHNQLTSLPDSIGNLKNLQKLDFNGNKLDDYIINMDLSTLFNNVHGAPALKKWTASKIKEIGSDEQKAALHLFKHI